MWRGKERFSSGVELVAMVIRDAATVFVCKIDGPEGLAYPGIDRIG